MKNMLQNLGVKRFIYRERIKAFKIRKEENYDCVKQKMELIVRNRWGVPQDVVASGREMYKKCAIKYNF
jgi:hypothetical protein